jgi:Protein of unknown function (DUF2949)
MAGATQIKLLSFLKDELSLSSAAIDMAMRQREQDPGPLPMILWKYGFVTLDELDQIYDWLKTV